jgi:hypothetical protein
MIPQISREGVDYGELRQQSSGGDAVPRRDVMDVGRRHQPLEAGMIVARIRHAQRRK